MKTSAFLAALFACLVSLTGCVTAYKWTSSVPAKMRTVSVPTFRNETYVTELGSVATRQVLREIQREGSFRIARASDAAVEIQGVIKSVRGGYSAGDRRSGARLGEYVFSIVAVVSIVDRVNGRVLVDNRTYTAETTYVGGQDRLTGERDASGRAAEDLAMQIVDDLTSMQW